MAHPNDTELIERAKFHAWATDRGYGLEALEGPMFEAAFRAWTFAMSDRVQLIAVAERAQRREEIMERICHEQALYIHALRTK